MKKLMLFYCIVSCTIFCHATIRRVGYSGPSITNVDYTTVQLAHNAANTGDTIQIYYGINQPVTLTKKLYVVSFGFNLDNNIGLQVINTRTTGKITATFNVGSQNTILEGITLNNTVINASNITFKRCYFESPVNFNSITALDNIQFIGCPFQNPALSGCCGSFPSTIVEGGLANHTNILFANCFFRGSNGGIGALTINFSPNSTGRIVNCINQQVASTNGTGFQISNSKFIVKNCIFLLEAMNSGPAANTIYENNFFINAAPSAAIFGSNNKFSQVVSTLLAGNNGAYSTCFDLNATCFKESFYALKTGSPAINGGFNESGQPTDCGIFGGEPAWVYRLGGVPSIPAIYKLTVPSVNASSNPYNVTISVRSNN